MLVVTRVVQSSLAALLVQSRVLQYRLAEGRGLVEQSSKTGFSPASEELKKRGRLNEKQIQKVHIQPQGSTVMQAVRLRPFVRLPKSDFI